MALVLSTVFITNAIIENFEKEEIRRNKTKRTRQISRADKASSTRRNKKAYLAWVRSKLTPKERKYLFYVGNPETRSLKEIRRIIKRLMLHDRLGSPIWKTSRTRGR
jgi:hypothetical protein